MKYKLTEALETALVFCVITFAVSVIILMGIMVYREVFPSNNSESTKVCRDGKLYEVTTEGNITIYESAYRDCEETK